jgi:hypothetical protein
MRSAERFLRDVDAGFDLPARRRVALLRELRTDFEDLVAALVAEGCTPEAARSRAISLLVPTPSEVHMLVGLHRPWYARLAGRLPSRYARWAELTGIGGMAVLATLMPFLAVAVAADLSGWVAICLGLLAATLVAHLSWHAFRVLVREDVDAAGLARAGMIQAGLIGLTLAVGALVIALATYAAAGSWTEGVDVAGVASWVATGAEIAALTLSIGMFGLFGGAAVYQAQLSAQSVEEELDRLLGTPLLSSFPLQAGEDAP